METLEKPLAKRRIRALRLIHGGPNMEARMTRAETTNEHTLLDIGGLKHDLRELRVYVDEQFRRLEAKMDTRFGVLETSMRASGSRASSRRAFTGSDASRTRREVAG
jgi:hypothetical protein